jgi:hypothetical protein
MTSQTLTVKKSYYRSSAYAAIASGIIGIIAYGFLVGYLVVRNQNYQMGAFVVRFHDAGVILQFLLFIPVSFALFKLSEQSYLSITRTLLNIGIGAIAFAAMFLLLGFPKIIADVLYMFPQGVFGVWIMIVCWRMKGTFSPGLRWFGILVGLGLALVGIFPLGYALFVDKMILQIPAATDEAVAKIPTDTTANIILHKIIWIGSFMGVLTLPFWTILLGKRLFREDRKVNK